MSSVLAFLDSTRGSGQWPKPRLCPHLGGETGKVGWLGCSRELVRKVARLANKAGCPVKLEVQTGSM